MRSLRTADVVFFLSGAAALVYQVAWARLLSRLTGSDTVGVALVLAVFMAGMGLGSWLAAERVRAARHPRRLFAVLATVMALWASASPFLLHSLEPVASLPARVGVAGLLLVVPTAIMGATFPLMGRLTIAGDEHTGPETARFYGANTLGAATGALLGALVVFPLLGLSRGLLAGAALDLASAALALRLPPLRPADAPPSAPDRVGSLRGRSAGLVMTALFGASSLGLEVVLTRLLITVTGASVFAFAIVLTVFLAGIGLGGRSASELLARPGGAARLARRCALWIPVAGLAGLWFLAHQLGEHDLFGVLANRMPEGAATPVLWASHALFAGLALFPPAWGFGLALPACTALVVEARGSWSRESAMGRLYAFNTAGATLGSLGAGFLLLPLLGPRVAVGLAFAVTWLASLPAAALERGRPRASLAWAVPTFAALLLGALVLRHEEPDSAARTLFHEYGRDSTVSVIETPSASAESPPVRSLLVNGKVVATTAPVDLRLQRLLGTIPARLHGAPRRALVIGLGTGMTAGALLDFPSIEELTVFEISETVREGARRFTAWNGGIVDDPRARIEIVDGRHALALSDAKFDLVTSDPIHPWTRGSSDLYALEHFSEMAAHLAPGGLASQWLPLYQLATEDVKTIVATWCAAFPHTSAWLTAYDLVLVGSNSPHGIDGRFRRPLPARVAASLSEAGLHSWPELAALLVAEDGELRALAAGTRPMLEDHPRLEFRAPLSYLAGYSTEVLAWAAASFPESLPPESRERAHEVRELLERFLEELPNGLSAAAENYGRRLLRLPALSPPDESR